MSQQGGDHLFLYMCMTDKIQLDAGIEERIMLVSRDEQSCLVVSYREIKACIESAFGYARTYRLPNVKRTHTLSYVGSYPCLHHLGDSQRCKCLDGLNSRTRKRLVKEQKIYSHPPYTVC